MSLLLQRLFRSQQSAQQLVHLQGGYALSGVREFSAASPGKPQNRGLGSSRAEGTAPRFYKYVGVEPVAGQVCLKPRVPPAWCSRSCLTTPSCVVCRIQAGKSHSMTELSKPLLGNRLLFRHIPSHLLLLQNGSGRYSSAVQTLANLLMQQFADCTHAFGNVYAFAWHVSAKLCLVWSGQPNSSLYNAAYVSSCNCNRSAKAQAGCYKHNAKTPRDRHPMLS